MDNNKSKDINYISLYQFLDKCDNNSKRKIIYFVSKNLKGLHSNNYYVPYLNMKMILVNPSKLSDIKFSKVVNGKDNENIDIYKNENIYELSLLSFAAYLPDYSIEENGMLNSNVIRDKFEDFSYIFNSNDVDYYRDVLVNNSYTYYSDYIDNMEIKKGNSVGNNKSYVYSTKEGKLYAEEEAAFSSYLLLLINIVVIGLILGVMLLYL